MDASFETRQGPWNPDRQWADPLITLLMLLCVLLGMAHLRARSMSTAKPPEHVGLMGRVAEVQALGQKLGRRGGAFKGGLIAFQERMENPWDRALLSVLLAESADQSDRASAKDLALSGPASATSMETFRKGWAWAYSEGPALDEPDQKILLQALGGDYGARLLRARWAERQGQDATRLRQEAEALAMGRVLLFGAVGLVVLGLAFAGAAFAVMLILTRKVPRRFSPVVYGMSPRAALLVFFGWLTVQMGSGFLVAPLWLALPFLKAVALPLAYGLQVAAGVSFLCAAEGITLRQLAHRVAPGSHGRSLAWGLGFLALALASVLAVALLLAPFLKAAQPPQKELLELVGKTSGPFSLSLLFLTVAVVAPCFEELMFRGFLLPFLSQQWKSLRGGTWMALLATGLLFGLIHLQPVAIPTLATLGIVLGLAVLRTGNLLTSILVHGLWNGGVFLIMRLFLT
ncbi:MAG: CPBP family intramembrane metalloprotease [Acidobacteriota bacterium]|nr:CPBP family intramembrane metalloprotease [Acidobacteriota bacterium]